MTGLARFLHLLTVPGALSRTRSVVVRELTRETFDLLTMLGILVEGPPVATAPCEEPGSTCERTVGPGEGEDDWIAICRDPEGTCRSRALSGDEVRTVRLEPAALCELLARSFGVTKREPVRWTPPRVALGAADGRRHSLVVAALDPRDADPDEVLLIPTPTLAVPGARTVSLPKALRLVPTGFLARLPKAGADEVLPPVSRFEDVRIQMVDGHTIRVTIRGASARFSYHDLGLVNGRTKEPSRGFELLREVCEGSGEFRTVDFGGVEAARKQLDIVRAALRKLVGCGEDPFEKRGKGWRARFVARGVKG